MKLPFITSDRIIELVLRGGGFADLEGSLMLNQAIAMGRGGGFLNLTPERYSKLKR